MQLTFFPNITTTIGYTATTTWQQLISHHEVTTSKDTYLYHPATFTTDPPVRNQNNLDTLQAIIIDVDNDYDRNNPLHPNDLVDLLPGVELFWHSTHSNMCPTKGKPVPKFRLIVPLSTPVTPDTFSQCWEGLYAILNKEHNIDTSCKSPARAYYVPSCPPHLQQYAFHGSQEGAQITPATLVGEYQRTQSTKPSNLFSEPQGSFDSNDLTPDDIDDALSSIPADCDYETWRNVGMALKDEYGDMGFSLWDRWSQSSPQSYPTAAQPSTQRQWQSFVNSGITIATLIDYAQQHGWVYPHAQQPDYEDGVMLQGGNLWPYSEDDPRNIAYKEAKTQRITSAPGLVGMLTDWINRSSRKPQPQLALAASISAVGVLMGHRYATETDLRSNMLVLGVAPSGAGKDHARKCIVKLFRECGVENLIGGSNVSSGAAVLSSLVKSGGRKLFLLDEIGIKLKAFTSSAANSYQTDVLATAMEMFSTANSTYYGTEYADQTHRPRVDVDQPCMCLYGTTVPSRFYEAISAGEAADGFLPRFLTFTSTVRTPEKNHAPDSMGPPREIVEVVKQIIEDTNPDMQQITPKVIPFTDRARELFFEFADLCDKEGDKEYELGTSLDAIWSRGCEHAYKLALLCHSHGQIDAHVAKWCIELVKQQIDESLQFLKSNLSSSPFEQNVQELRRYLSETPEWTSKTAISRRMGKLKPKELTEVLNALAEREMIVTRQVQSSPTAKRKTTEFKIATS